jgi:hypothetical protein
LKFDLTAYLDLSQGGAAGLKGSGEICSNILPLTWHERKHFGLPETPGVKISSPFEFGKADLSKLIKEGFMVLPCES